MKKENTEEKKRKKHLKWQIKLILIIIFLCTFIYFIGTKGIFIKEYKIENSKINENMDGIKIVQFSDIHYNSNISKKKIKNIVNKINSTKPDIVIFTGDLIDKNYNITESEKSYLKKELSKISSEFGKFYITGENDFNDANEILNISSFANLNDNKELIYVNRTTPITLYGKESLKKDINNNILDSEDNFKVLSIHNPNDIDEFRSYNIDIALAGHTHNGQINIPKLKELFINSKYYNDYQKVNNISLFINPGIGTSKLNIRVFNHPTIYLFRLYKTK